MTSRTSHPPRVAEGGLLRGSGRASGLDHIDNDADGRPRGCFADSSSARQPVTLKHWSLAPGQGGSVESRQPDSRRRVVHRTLGMIVAAVVGWGLAAGPAHAAPRIDAWRVPIGKHCIGPARPALALPMRSAAALRAAAPAECPAAPAGVCGSLAVPLDPSRPNLGTISIGYELYRHSDSSESAAGTL